MTEEKELIKKRGSIKGRITAFANHLSTLNTATLSSSEARELQLRIGKIESLYDQYDEVQLKIECSSDNSEAQINERTDFERHYYRLLADAQGMLDIYTKNLDKVESISSSRSNHKLVKLPTIQLPKFEGSYEKWLEFHDTFSSLIDNNDQIDEINKFHYLRASLEGSAAVVIQSIEFSASNYPVAWKLLCERFDNKRLLVQNHVSALFNIEPVTKESSAILKRVIDQLNKNLRALESLGEPIKHWDTLLIYLVTQKLDATTFREWEEHKGTLSKDKPISLIAFLEFMRNRADLIETIELSKNNATSSKQASKIKALVSYQSNDNKNNTSTSSMKPCPNCNDDHYLNNCPKFLALSSDARYKLLPTYKICFNCFRSGHYANSCKRPGCKVCKRKHHSLIHINEFGASKQLSMSVPTATAECDSSNRTNNVVPTVTSAENASVTLTGSITTTCEKSGQCDVLLSTALVKLYDCDNREVIARAILDSGSTSCLMTERLHKQLNLPADCTDRTVVGINNKTSRISQMCRLPIKSLCDSFSTYLSCFILPSITDNVPGCQIDVKNLNIPSDICLADPQFYSPSAVDLIIGADVFWDILGSQNIKLGDGKPILYETRLGWIVSGPVNGGRVSTLPLIKCNFTKVDSLTSHCSDDDIQNQLTRFWQLEEVSPQSSHYFPEEKQCEEHFVKNTTRLADGRFCVRIPLKQTPSVLGDSYQRAKHCLLSLERRLKNNDSFSKMYVDFLSEYESLGHMTECKPVTSVPHYFIPHHGVLRESSTTTKLRVVFNASSPTTSGVSFNQIQMIGPTVQDDLLSILLRFRQHKYVVVADVEKMYRCIEVHPDCRPLQQIIWRDQTQPNSAIKCYMLNRVSYGTASAPYLATRCLKQIGLDCKDPKISEIIIHDCYVDDFISGGDELSEVLRIRKQVTAELASAGMPLRKWKSNEPQLLPETDQFSSEFNIGCTESSKTLGLGWHSVHDKFYFSISPTIAKGNTKRDILSVIAQIFDPLGLISPCVILMKILLQKLWLQRLSWDDELPPEIKQAWREVVDTLPGLNSLRIPRRVICDSYSSLELHIYTDASERAYGACVYVRSTNDEGEVSVHLLIAKSRVAPIKPATIPRLELCGALIGARLYEKARTALRAQIKHVVFWTDSMIVLGWLKMLPSKLQPFVRNRIADILETTGSCTWRHVPTDENPADIISRGVSVTSLQSLTLWWQGPDYLKRDPAHWPATPSTVDKLPETRNEVSLIVHNSTSRELIDFSRFSNLSRLQRTVAYVLRFINVLKKGTKHEHKYLNTDELDNALILILKQSQSQSFPEYNLLIKKQDLPSKSSLIKFNVYLDENNLIRVGGRLDNSSFKFEKKHPIILQSTHQVTKLLFEFEHKKLMHAGPQLLLATIRETYWPIGGRNLAKKCFRQCVRCNRMKGKTYNPLMGNLPQQRIKPGGYPFESVGVDYAGPVVVASRTGRGCRLTKSYIGIFVCFTTKAVHLELVGDLTSNNYLLALRRFISRRGKPTHIFSDNGTSFVGAYNDISKFLKSNCDTLASETAQDSINFHFIPAYSPNFGGLWEAGVKSTKYHLNRVLGNCNLTFEELTTTLVQIEAILNSRPLSPLSSDPEDLTPLTPGHFLIGRPLTALPERNYQDYPVNRLTRFQRIAQLRQHFWTRWSKEYIAELQQRVKWRSCKYSLKNGTLVLIKEDGIPPLKWKLGRVVAVHPGPSDGICRVADIKLSTGVVRRSFSKIVPLLPEDDVSR